MSSTSDQVRLPTEYQNANERLGDVSVKPVWSVFSIHKTPYLPTLLALVGDFPIVKARQADFRRVLMFTFRSIADFSLFSNLRQHLLLQLPSFKKYQQGSEIMSLSS